MNNKISKVMTFSATDPTSGAGLQADILTLSSIGCYPLSVATGISVQDTIGVESLSAISAELVNDQARNILEDMTISVFKCGVLGSTENIRVVAEIAADYPKIPLIIDPVISSGRGDELLDEEMLEAMKDLLFPQAYLITPNSYEARRLIIGEKEIFEEIDIALCADRLKLLGCDNILITGTHENTKQVVNTLFDSFGKSTPFYWERLPDQYHGSGCTLTSAIAGYLAQGLMLQTSVERAQYYTWQTLKHSFKPGMGQYIPNRSFSTSK